MAITEQHTVIRPTYGNPLTYENPPSVVRDHDAPGPGEDLDRQPDGVPHVVVGLTIVVSVLLALAVVGMFAVTSWSGRGGAIALAAVAVVLLMSMGRRIERDRDHVHPSR